MLAATETRCLGLYEVPFGTMRCTRRNNCLRFLERYAEGVTVKVWMCPGKDDYWQYQIPADEGETA
jgi:hypothetical protein